MADRAPCVRGVATHEHWTSGCRPTGVERHERGVNCFGQANVLGCSVRVGHFVPASGWMRPEPPPMSTPQPAHEDDGTA